MSGGMLPWVTRNRIANGVNELPEEVKTNTKMVVDKMRDNILRHNLCGEDCRKCEVKCNFGIEALKRGLDVIQQNKEPLKRGRRKALPKVVDRPEGYYSVDEMAQRWGVNNATVEHWVLAARIQPEYRYYAGDHKLLSLYREKRVVDLILAFASTGRHEIMKGRVQKVKEAMQI